MISFNIGALDCKLQQSVQEKIDNLNKPKHSLGVLEDIAMRICLVQETLSPSLLHPCHLLLGGDHGIEKEGVSCSPRDVTWQQMINFTKGGGGVNMFCRQHGFKLKIVDMGVDHDLCDYLEIRNMKISNGTRNFPIRHKFCLILLYIHQYYLENIGSYHLAKRQFHLHLR